MARIGICNACLLFLLLLPGTGIPASSLSPSAAPPPWAGAPRQGSAPSSTPGAPGSCGGCTAGSPTPQSDPWGLEGVGASEFAFGLADEPKPSSASASGDCPRTHRLRAGAQGVPAALEQQEAGPSLAGTEFDNSLPHRMMFYFHPNAFC